jgi:hypothetical protein
MVDEKAGVRMSLFESQRKTQFIARCRKMGAYARRVEDQYGVGVLDMVVAFSGLPVAFLEGKVVEHQAFAPTERQFIEGNRIIALEGGHAVPLLVAWGVDSGFHIHEWARKGAIKTSFTAGDGIDDAHALRNYLEQRVARNPLDLRRADDKRRRLSERQRPV